MDLSSSSVRIDDGLLTTWDKDAALSLDISGVALTGDPTQDHLTYVMTSYRQELQGQYLLAFHMGTTNVAPTKGGSTSGGLTGGLETGGG